MHFSYPSRPDFEVSDVISLYKIVGITKILSKLVKKIAFIFISDSGRS